MQTLPSIAVTVFRAFLTWWALSQSDDMSCHEKLGEGFPRVRSAGIFTHCLPVQTSLLIVKWGLSGTNSNVYYNDTCTLLLLTLRCYVITIPAPNIKHCCTPWFLPWLQERICELEIVNNNQQLVYWKSWSSYSAVRMWASSEGSGFIFERSLI